MIPARARWVAAVAGPVGVVALAAPGVRWSTWSASGSDGRLGPWAAALLVLGGAGVAAVALAAGRGRGMLGARLVAVVAGFGALAALTVAVERLVAAWSDTTSVVGAKPTAAAGLAPAALAVALVAGGAGARAAVRWGTAMAVAVALALGVGAGLWPVRPAVGTLSTGSGRPAAGFPVADGSFDADLVTTVGDTIVGANDGAIHVVDARGRWFPYAEAGDLRPDAYRGHRTEARRDEVSAVESLAGLFGRGRDLVIGGRDGVFTVRRGAPARLLVALAVDRSEVSLAELAAARVPVLTEGHTILGVGPDGADGLVVVTDTAVLRVAADGAVRPVPAAGAVLDPARVGDWVRVFVSGRDDGSIVLAVPCRLFEVPVAGPAELVADWSDQPCSTSVPPPVAVGGRGAVSVVTEDRRTAVVQAGSPVPRLDVAAAATFDRSDHLVVAYADGTLLRSPVGGR